MLNIVEWKEFEILTSLNVWFLIFWTSKDKSKETTYDYNFLLLNCFKFENIVYLSDREELLFK